MILILKVFELNKVKNKIMRIYKNLLLYVFIVILVLVSNRVVFAEKPYTPSPGSAERKAILDVLREGLKKFPELYSLDFQYKREDIKMPADVGITFVVNHFKIKDEWALIEVDIKDYCCSSLFALFEKKAGKWEILGIINFQYVVCQEKSTDCIDIKKYIYQKVRQKIPSAPATIFFEITKDREEIIKTLTRLEIIKSLPDTVFVVNHLKIKDNWAWVETNPRSKDGMSQYEPINALLYRKDGKWLIKKVQPCCGECEDDPYCAKGIYHKKLIKMYPSVPKDIFPNKTR